MHEFMLVMLDLALRGGCGDQTPTLYTNAPTSCATAGVDSPSSRRVPVKIWFRGLLDILRDNYCSSGAAFDRI
ncbi:uncharacterized protein CCOS01_10007 [Colletotrichum costaricense]|uniref:Secreted protein n=2 Tax=Colletotrichum acutatum species complex TaxID=2707335 RepID=A0AAJ0DZ44_9PEZI|nr:uncharacterized protein CCOS01_10007 [Colletotrichum costaricense]XP_060381138.1 uncharacterized protein CTAM01_08274 [Colletotrichum tamarilloi]KAK1496636.1 hypothetical protein CTAM01_08274 [Colletotrichum tamarilloi]KAK1522295.1 hypothetical protein CCOS01_10007 [Colletotrichum costaricense]